MTDSLKALVENLRTCICPLDGHRQACLTRRDCADQIDAARISQPQTRLKPDEHEAVKALLQTALDDIEEETPTMIRHVESLRALLSRSISPQPQAPTREQIAFVAGLAAEGLTIDEAPKYEPDEWDFRIADAILAALYADAAPTCEHGETKAHSYEAPDHPGYTLMCDGKPSGRSLMADAFKRAIAAPQERQHE